MAIEEPVEPATRLDEKTSLAGKTINLEAGHQVRDEVDIMVDALQLQS